MGYYNGNAFFGYNPNTSVFDLYSDIGESIPSDAVFDGNTVKGTINSNLVGNIIGDTTVTGDIYLGGNITSNLVLEGNQYIDRDLVVYGNAEIQTDLYVQYNTTMFGNNTIYGDLSISGNIVTDTKING